MYKRQGIYWTPFTDWGCNPRQKMDHAEQYTFGDAYLYAHGQPQKLDGAYALDPTHPAVEQRMKYFSELFRRTGFTYVTVSYTHLDVYKRQAYAATDRSGSAPTPTDSTATMPRRIVSTASTPTATAARSAANTSSPCASTAHRWPSPFTTDNSSGST